MEKCFDIGGMIVHISGADEEMFTQDGILAPFAVDVDTWDWEISCRIVDEFGPPQGDCVFTDPQRHVYSHDGLFISYIGTVGKSLEGAYIRTVRGQGRSDMEVKRSALPDRITPKVVLTSLEAEHLIVTCGGFLLHSSYICYEDSAILFTAPSGTGKSTQAELWSRFRGAEIINGDRSAVQMTERGFEALGVPFSGSSGISKNCRLPLKAIVCLAQAPQTSITRLTGLRAFRMIWEGCSIHTWNAADVIQCTETVIAAVSQVPVYYLACTPDESAVQALEEVLRK